MTFNITPALSVARALEIAQTLDLRQLPRDFLDNPYPVYAALRESAPFKRMPDGSFFLTRHADLVAVYRDAKVFSSDKQVEFGAMPKCSAQTNKSSLVPSTTTRPSTSRPLQRLAAWPLCLSTTRTAWCSTMRHATPACGA